MASSKPTQPLEDRFYRQVSGRWLLTVYFLALSVLAGRLFYLQIIKGSYHEKLSLQNSVRVQVVKAPRGLIFDRKGRVLARNRPSYQIALLPTQLRNPKLVLENLLRFTDSSGQRIFDSGLVSWSMDRAKWRKFQPLTILEDAPMEVVAMVEEHQLEIPGVSVVMESRRSYPYGKLASHVLGYMDEIKEEELAALKTGPNPGDSSLYQRGDRIGRKGLEKVYESHFRGRDGVRFVKVNAFGKVIEAIQELPEVKADPGHNLWTSIDLDMQAQAESLLADSIKGSVVVMDPRNGEIRVMVSSPGMDANIFSLSRDRRSKEWAKLVFDPDRPLNNRSVTGGYEPGSTFKAVVSLAGLESGKIHPHDHMARPCIGGYRFGNRFWRCWDPKGHGFTDLFTGFMQSCDGYYYQAGLLVGMNKINAMARQLGLGAKTGIDLDEERAGELIDSASYEKKFGKRGWHWSQGLVLNLSIGQGQIVTPLQLCEYAAGLANGKQLFRPHIMTRITNVDGKVVSSETPEVLHNIQITPENHAIMLEAMRLVISGPKGTGGQARVDSVTVGGKTGSAENPHGDKTHALFIAVAPLEAPEIAIAVILENVGHGGSFAAPVAGKILRRYFAGKSGG